MKKILILVIFALFVAELFAQFDVWVAKGEQAMYQKKYELAIESFSEAINLNDSVAHIYYQRGMAYLFNQNFDRAYQDFSRAILLDSTNPDAYNNRGYLLFINGNFIEAAPDFDRAIKLDPDFMEAYINRGGNYIDMNKIDSAVIDLKKAISMNKKNPSPYLELGRAYYRQKNYKLSAENYSQAIKLGLKSGKIYYNRGNSYFNLEDYQKAIKDYTESIKLDSTEYDALNNRAIAYEKTGKKALAEKDRETLRKLTGNEKIFMPPEQIKYVDAHDSTSSYSFVMPSHWNKVEYHSEFSDDVIISPENIEKITTPYSIGIKMSFNKNMGQNYKVFSADSLLDFWSGSMVQNSKDYANYQVVFAKQIAKYNKHGRHNQVNIKYTQDSYPYTLYEYALAEDNVLFYAFFQAPEKQFDLFKPVFDKILESITLIHKEK